MKRRVLATTDVLALEVAVPPGHRHLRGTLQLRDGEELVLQEATMAALVRAFVTAKTHPVRKEVRLKGRELQETDRKVEFACWQLLEEE